MAEIAPDVETATSVKQRSNSQRMANSTFAGLGNLIKLLPSGTFFLFTFLNPVLTNNGECKTSNKYATAIFLGLCSFTSSFSWFTDSYIDSEGVTQYGIVTRNGLFPLFDPDTSSVDLSKYKLQLGDFVHAFISVTVLALVALWDPNTVKCFYPSFVSSQDKLIMALLPVVGAVASTAFVTFPNKRYGIGHPPRKESLESESDS